MKLAICGVGAMGEALLAGWVTTIEPAEIGFVEPNDARANQISATYGVRRIEAADAAAAPVIVLAVKPHQIVNVIGQIQPTRDSLIISIAAGVSLATLEQAAPGVPVVRVMPNTPALVGVGMSGVCSGTSATHDHLAVATKLLEAVGLVLCVSETQLDALTAVSGSGPAYLFYVAEAMIEAGVHLGLTRDDATLLTEQTLLGAATLLRSSPDSATVLREKVTSPAGTTAAALASLDTSAVRAAFLQALRAAHDRGREMASPAKSR